MSAEEMARTQRHLAQVSRMGETIATLRRMKKPGETFRYRTKKEAERVQRCLNVYNSLNEPGLTPPSMKEIIERAGIRSVYVLYDSLYALRAAGLVTWAQKPGGHSPSRTITPVWRKA